LIHSIAATRYPFLSTCRRSFTTSNEPALGIYANGNIKFEHKGLELSAQLYANAKVELKQEKVLRGSITAKGEDIRIYYIPVSTALTDPIWPLN